MAPLFLYYDKAIDWLQSHLLACPSKQYLHIECPGCGLQRSVLLLLKGDVADSFAMYPAAIPILWIFAFTFLHLKYRFANGAVIIKYSACAVGVLILVFYIYKVVNHKITS